MELVYLNDIWKLKDEILSKISIIDIAKEYGIELEEKETGTFTHRAYCILHSGKGYDGRERTPSLFFSKHSNSFCCFGCSTSGSLLDFIRHIDGTPPVVILNNLAKRLGIVNDDGKQNLKFCSKCEEFTPLKTISPYVFKISDLLREYIFRFKDDENFEKELKWMEKVAEKTDYFLKNMGYEDWEDAKYLCDNVEKVIKKRLKNKGKK